MDTSNMIELREFPGYFVTPEGEIYSNRTCAFLKPYNIGKGYRGISLRGRDRFTKILLHQLVAETFLKNSLANGTQKCFKNGVVA